MEPIRFACLLLLLVLGCATKPISRPAVEPAFVSCPQDEARLKSRSEELQRLVNEDQHDRTPPVDWAKVAPRDERRRQRIGEIFGEGCFKSAEDYAAAALVYQHGVQPDHFFQTFLWAQKSVELGDASQKWLMAAGIDRYLVNTGHKQLFATQASAPENECWCLEDVEPSFPKHRRTEYAKKTSAEALKWVECLNANVAGCKAARICAKGLRPTPPGTIPGFW